MGTISADAQAWEHPERKDLVMKSHYLPWYALALAAVFVAALAIGVPLSTLALLLVVLACPLMMMFMMGGMGGGHGNDTKHDLSDTPDHKST